MELTRFLVEDSINAKWYRMCRLQPFYQEELTVVLYLQYVQGIKEKGEKLGTFSFDFVDNDKYLCQMHFSRPETAHM